MLVLATASDRNRFQYLVEFGQEDILVPLTISWTTPKPWYILGRTTSRAASTQASACSRFSFVGVEANLRALAHIRSVSSLGALPFASRRLKCSWWMKAKKPNSNAASSALKGQVHECQPYCARTRSKVESTLLAPGPGAAGSTARAGMLLAVRT